MSVCMCTFLVPTETQRGCWSPWRLELEEVDCSDPRPLQELHVLLPAEPSSLQPPGSYFCFLHVLGPFRIPVFLLPVRALVRPG